MSPIVHFEQVGLRYGTGSETLSNLSFLLEPGSFHIVSGAAGAGKTSLVRLATLAQRPSRGIIRLFGEDVVTLSRDMRAAVRRRIGVVHQDFRLLPHLTAFENVALPLRIMEREEGTIRSSVAEMLDWMGLAARAEARPATLSGGEQQRVAIARALIAQPELMVADEPMANLDRDMAARILRLLDGLNRTGATILVATRDPGLAACVPNASVTRLARGGMEDLSGPQRPPAAPRRAYP